MTAKSKIAIAAGVLMLGMLAIPVVRRGATGNAAGGQEKEAAYKSPSPADGGEVRALPAGEWKLPFRLKPRLTPEQAAILSAGRAGDHLRRHPQDDNLLVAWAAADPDGASAWLDSVGEIEVDGVGYYLSHLSALAAGVFAHGGIAEMQALLEKHARDPLLPPKYQEGGFDSHPWFKMAREDTGQEAIAWLQAIRRKPSSPEHFSAVSRTPTGCSRRSTTCKPKGSTVHPTIGNSASVRKRTAPCSPTGPRGRIAICLRTYCSAGIPITRKRRANGSRATPPGRSSRRS